MLPDEPAAAAFVLGRRSTRAASPAPTIGGKPSIRAATAAATGARARLAVRRTRSKGVGLGIGRLCVLSRPCVHARHAQCVHAVDAGRTIGVRDTARLTAALVARVRRAVSTARR